MGKDPSRKAKRTPKPRDAIEPIVDGDLAELAAVLNEYRLDNNAAGWFTLPWRSGWNVVRLMLATHLETRALDGRAVFETPPMRLLADRVSDAIRDWTDFVEVSNEVYQRAEEFKIELAGFARSLGCALRCLQLLIAKSDGGGHVYNDVVRPCYEALDPKPYASLVLDARCRDAIGVGAQLQNDRHDRKRRAFTIAWQRGLYHAAYSIAPVA